MPVEDQSRVVFDPALLGRAEDLLLRRPEQPAVSAAAALTIDAGAFGTVPGGAEAGSRLETFATRARSEMSAVAAEVAALAGGTGTARRLATDVNGQTQAAAQRATPSGGTSGGTGGR